MLIDIVLIVDGLKLDDDMSIDDLVKDLEERWTPAYPIIFEVIGENE